MQTKTAQLMPPLAITEIVHATWLFKVLFAAVDLNIFEPLRSGEQNAKFVAKQLELNETGTLRLLEGLAAMQLLVKNGDNFGLTDVARNYLLKDSRVYMGAYLRVAERSINPSWDAMADCVRSGKPDQEVNKRETAEEFFPDLAAAIFPMNYAIAQMVVEKLKLQDLKLGARVLDIAAGSGVWSIPVAESNSNVSIDAVDFPAVLQVTRKFALRHNVAPQFNYIAKDWRQIALEPNSYDVIMIGHLLHSEGKEASEELLRKVNPALKEGGWVVIGEFLTNEERTAPPIAVLFAMNMYLHTTQGCVFTYRELKEMLEIADYQKIERLTLPMFGDQSPVVVAQRK